MFGDVYEMATTQCLEQRRDDKEGLEPRRDIYTTFASVESASDIQRPSLGDVCMM